MRRKPYIPFALAVLGLSPLVAQTPKEKPPDTDIQDLLELMNTPVVSASKSVEKLSEAPATLIVISKGDIEARGYTKFYEILDDLPGFDLMKIYGDTFLKPYARGYRNDIGDTMLVMVDGQVFNHLWYGTIDGPLAYFPLASVERVEVVYGPASAVYGANAFMGVINVITTKGGEGQTSLKANLIGGSLKQRGVDLSLVEKLGSWRLSFASRVYQGDMDGDAANRYVYTSKAITQGPIPGGGGRTIFGKMLEATDTSVTSPYTERWFDLRLANGPFEFGATYGGLVSGYGMMWVWDSYIPNQARWVKNEWSLFAKASFDITPALNTTGTARYRKSSTGSESVDYEVDWSSSDPGMAPGHPFTGPGFYVLPEFWAVDTTSLTYTQDFEWRASTKLSVNFGYVVSQEIQQKNYGYSPDNPDDGLYWFASSNFNPNDLPRQPVPDLGDDNHFAVLRRGAYVQAKYRLDDHQNLVLGLRNDWQSVFKGANTLRAGYVGNWGGWQAKALYGQAYNEPPGRLLGAILKVAESSSKLRPERSNTAEVSVGYTERRWSILGDLYRVTNTSTVLGSINAGTTVIDALDVHANLLLPNPWGKENKIWAYGSHHFKQTRTPFDFASNVLNSDEVPDISKNQVHVGWTSTFAHDLMLTLRGRYFSQRETVATNPIGNIPGYGEVDFYGQVGLGVKGLSAGLKVTNLLDKAYEQPGMRKGSSGLVQPYFDTNGDYVGSWVSAKARNLAIGYLKPNGKPNTSGLYNTSLLPQAGRAFEVVIRYKF